MPASSPTVKRHGLVGVISDTHGLLRPEAILALQGCDLILHAGDIGTRAILEDLQAIAPVIAVKGNNDQGKWANTLPVTHRLTVGRYAFLLTHDAAMVSPETVTPPIDVLVSGHSHKPAITERNGIIFLNPGSAGPKRFTLPISLARIIVRESQLIPELVHLSG